MQEHYHDESNTYTPLVVVFLLIIIAAAVVSFVSGLSGITFLKTFLTNFMIGFFLVFSAFKLMDLKGFAKGYSTYDLLAQKVFGYGYIYPFIELFFGLAMIVVQSQFLLVAEIVIMGFSGLGVLIKLLKKEKFQCACLGTFLKVPLTKITLVEDFGMAILAILLLFLQ